MNRAYLLYITLFTLALSWIHREASAQKQNAYTASNGYTITVGDTVMLGVGSAPDGRFQHIYESMAQSIFAALADDYNYDFRLPEYFQGAPVVIKKIKQKDNETLLIFNTEGWGAFVIDAEAAIASCEIAFCRNGRFLSQEEFEKLVLLYRAALDGDISAERFESLRKELIDSGQ